VRGRIESQEKEQRKREREREREGGEGEDGNEEIEIAREIARNEGQGRRVALLAESTDRRMIAATDKAAVNFSPESILLFSFRGQNLRSWRAIAIGSSILRILTFERLLSKV
jgi:hypothetical protein